MAIEQCPRCNSMFDKSGFPVCSKCQLLEEDDYEKVRQILDHNEGWPAERLAEESGVDLAVVLRMLDQGMVSDINLSDVRCGRCGRPAISSTKKICQKCLGELEKQVAKVNQSSRNTKSGLSVRQSIETKGR